MVILAGSGWGMLQAAKIEECYRQMRYLRKLIFRIRSEIRYSRRVLQILGCTDEEVAPFVHLSILAINNYMIFAERALFVFQKHS